MSGQVVLVVAPAGFGKSVALSQWADGLDLPVAWVALGDRDNDPGHLLLSLLKALEGSHDGRFEQLRRQVGFVTPRSAPKLAEQLATELGQAKQCVLVLDDVHLIDDPNAIDVLRQLTEALPENVHLYLAARHDPPIPFGRRRLSGGLTEIRQAELAFTLMETGQLLARHRIKIDDADLNVLHMRTEGWGAAIRLALLSMRQTGEPARVVRNLVGTDRVISEYLVEEVLTDMSTAKQQFLTRTSILEEVNPDIAEALTGRSDANLVLEELAAAGDFTERSQTPGWYRYHHLLRDLLRAQLHEADPAAVADLHGRAARWYRRHDYPVPAVNHAIAGGDVDEATAFLTESATGLVASGQALTVADLSGKLLDLVSKPEPLLLMTRLWALYNIFSEPTEIDRLMDELESLLEQQKPETIARERVHGGDPRSFADRSALPWLRALKARTHGDLAALVRLNTSENVPSPSGRVEMWLAEGLLWLEQYEEAEVLLDTYQAHAESEQYIPSMVHHLGLRAFALVGRGKLAEAEATIDQSTELIVKHGIAHLFHTSYAQLAHGWLRWERGDLSAAEASLVASQEFVEQWGDIPVSTQHAMLRSRTRWSLGDRAGARDLLDQATVTTTGRLVTGHFADRLRMARSHLEILEDEPLAAERWLPTWRARLAEGPTTTREFLLLARLAVAVHEPNVEFVANKPAEPLTPFQSIELKKLEAARALANHDLDRATVELVEAMSTARTVGATQRLLDEQRTLRAVYDKAAEVSGFKVATNEGATGDNPFETGSARSLLVEEISEREMEVLALLSTHLTYAEIAEDLCISLNTVKSHSKAIFRKLAVSRRSDAVSRARQLGLLS